MKEILKNLDLSIELPQDTYLEQDPEILEFFVEELEDIFETLRELLDVWSNGDLDDEQIITLRRSFHTLKGSGRMVGAKSSSELAWNVEDNLNRVIAKNRELTPELKQFVILTVNFYQYKFYDEFKQQKPHRNDIKPLIVIGQSLQQGNEIIPELKSLLDLSETLNSTDDLTGLEFEDVVTESVVAYSENVMDEVVDVNAENSIVDHQNIDFSATEVSNITVEAEPDLNLENTHFDQISDQGSMNAINIDFETDVINNNEKLELEEPIYEFVTPIDDNLIINDDIQTDLADRKDATKENEEPIHEFVTPIDHKFVIDTDAQAEFADQDNIAKETLIIFFEEAEEHVDTIRKFIKDEQYTPDQFNLLIRALHTLRGSSSMAHVNDIFEATSKVDHLFKVFVQEDREIDFREYSLLGEFVEFVEDYLYQLKKPQYKKFDLMLVVQKFQEAWDSYDFEITNLHQPNQSISAVSQLVNLKIDQLLDAEFEFDKRAQTEYPDYFNQLIEQSQILIDNTNNPTAIGIYQFTSSMKQSYEDVLKNRALLDDDYIYELFGQVHQNFIHLFDTLASGQRVTLNAEANKMIESLRDFTHQDLERFAHQQTNPVETLHLAQAQAVEEQQQPLFEEIEHIDNQALSLISADVNSSDEEQVVEVNEAQFVFDLEKDNQTQNDELQSSEQQVNREEEISIDSFDFNDTDVQVLQDDNKLKTENLDPNSTEVALELDESDFVFETENAIKPEESLISADGSKESKIEVQQDNEVDAFLNAELKEDQAPVEQDNVEVFEPIMVDDIEFEKALTEVKQEEAPYDELESVDPVQSDQDVNIVDLDQKDDAKIEHVSDSEPNIESADEALALGMFAQSNHTNAEKPLVGQDDFSQDPIISVETEQSVITQTELEQFDPEIIVDEKEDQISENNVIEEVAIAALAMPIDEVMDLPQQVGSQVGDLNYVVQNIAADRDLKDSADNLNDFDLEVLDIFIEEAEELLGYIDVDLSSWSENLNDTKALNNLMRHLHTLKGGANMAQAENVGLIAHELETIYEMVIKGVMQPSDQLVKTIRLIQDDLVDRIQILSEEQVDYSSVHVIEVLKNLVNPQKNSAIRAPETLASLWSKRKNADEQDDFADIVDDEQLDEETKAEADIATSDELLVEEINQNDSLADEANGLSSEEAVIVEEVIAETAVGEVVLAQSDSVDIAEQLAESVDATENAEILLTGVESDIDEQISSASIDDPVLESELEAAQSKESIAEVQAFMATGEDPDSELTTLSELVGETQKQTEHEIEEHESETQKSLDSKESNNEILDVFVSEAAHLINESLNLLQQWTEQRHNRSLLLQLQRNAHSIKGGSKMVGLDLIGEISYELEVVFEQFGINHFNSNAYDALLESAFVWLRGAVLEKNYDYSQSLKAQLTNIQYVDVTAQLPTKFTRSDLLLQEFPTEFEEGDGTEPPSMLGEWDDSEKIEQNDEMIRISAETIEKMIDLAGENAINRSRIEMDLSQFGHTLSEMELAIQRLADQLRRMEGELESQIIAIHGDANSRYEDFDPLEMDQYSSLNQLSKSLAESASDLVDFKTTLSEKIKDTEGILLQQSRIQAEIQEGLMRARLVPFSRLLPRLQRLVRQVSTTLNKPAELVVNNTEGELDRTILEKMVSPLEHMLRNALDHGLEDTKTRVKLGKPESGRIELDISRQGTDVVISFTDDGQGIQPDKIREKALAQNLIQPDQQLTDDQVLQFIFHPGFSTAEKVTQISGRGVGLDVVQSGIKSLGGEVTVESVVGKGSTFKIRVPTTVAVSDALMVKVLDQQFAVPLSQIDRIVRIAPSELETFFSSADDAFVIDDQTYKLRYLSEFIGGQAVPKLSGAVSSLPVLLIKGSRGQTSAVLVDQLVGSRSQIVMKPIGDQFNNIGAISGATILGDGQVCLILDGQNIARHVQMTNRNDTSSTTNESTRHRDERRLIMIVDDSVTVRKVTSRLLERQGFDVVTAKDGVDAIEQLHTVRPDLMLLDIEMPRMDGFEVTSLIRHDEVHKTLPIIMITSRTGEKHRERAMSLGVTSYMGKPFQEDELLATIQKLLDTK